MVAENKSYKFMSRDLTGDEWGQAWSLQVRSQAKALLDWPEENMGGEKYRRVS
jgi:hypothetical protein